MRRVLCETKLVFQISHLYKANEDLRRYNAHLLIRAVETSLLKVVIDDLLGDLTSKSEEIVSVESLGYSSPQAA